MASLLLHSGFWCHPAHLTKVDSTGQGGEVSAKVTQVRQYNSQNSHPTSSKSRTVHLSTGSIRVCHLLLRFPSLSGFFPLPLPVLPEAAAVPAVYFRWRSRWVRSMSWGSELRESKHVITVRGVGAGRHIESLK